MKKTIAVLFLLAGIASAEEWPITLGSYFTDSQGNNLVTVDAVHGKTQTQAQQLDGLTDADFYSGVNSVTTFTVYTGELLTSSGVTSETTVEVTSITLSSACRNDFVGNNRHLEITVNGQTYYSDKQQTKDVASGIYGDLIFTFSGDNVFSFNVGDNLAVSFPVILNVEHNAYGVFKGQTGVSNIITPAGQAAWQTAVKITGTATPEPATATLSLLALAGLASRRRRH